MVYQFSGGRAKGRGSLKGAQREETWNNIMLSTGEVALSEYASKAGGAAARIISLQDEPFEKDYDFSSIHKAVQENYGAAGLHFLIDWQIQKASLIPEFYKFKEHYLKKANGNEVLSRLSMYYAAVHFAGSVMQKLFNVVIDLKELDRLFGEIAKENKALDKPKELLEQILQDLDSSRRNIYYTTEPDFIKAVYKFNTLCLTPAYLKERLGSEEKLIRREWMKRGFTQMSEREGKTVDYKQVKHDGKKFSLIVINQKAIEEFGFDFSRKTTY